VVQGVGEFLGQRPFEGDAVHVDVAEINAGELSTIAGGKTPGQRGIVA